METLDRKFSIEAYLTSRSESVNSYIESYFARPDESVPGVLRDAMRYSLMAGGKRIRPILAMAAYEACGGDFARILPCASALEVIHTYSLIHDDLPAMDDDDLRRGRPTNHKVFGEAVAILAGDGLLSEAFMMMLSNAETVDRDNLFLAIKEVARAAGPAGMVGGQVQDILSEASEPDEGTLLYIHRHKTGALLASSVRMGGILYGADDGTMAALDTYGWSLGLAFQIVDDILDVSGDEAVLGKPVGSDLENNKLTYPSIFGIDESMRKAGVLINEAVDAIAPLGVSAMPLREIALYILRRTH